MGMTVRELAVKLGLQVDDASFKRGDVMIGALRQAGAALADMAIQAGKAMIEKIAATAEAGHEIERLSQVTGVGVEALQRLQVAGEMVGVSTETMNMGLRFLSRNMDAARRGGEAQARAFRSIGVAVTDSHGKLRDADAVLGDIANRFATMPDGAQKTALAMQVMGRGGAQMIPLLNQGAKGIDELSSIAVTMSKEDIKASKELVVVKKQVGVIMNNLLKQAILPLLPSVRNLIKLFVDWYKTNKQLITQRIEQFAHIAMIAIQALGDTVQTVGAILGWFREKWEELGPVGKAIAAGLALAFLIAFAPVMPIIAGLAGLVLILNSIARWKAHKDSLFGEWIKQLDEWTKAKPGDPWWLVAVKDLIGLLQQALGLTDRLEKKFTPSGNIGKFLGFVGDRISDVAEGFGDIAYTISNPKEAEELFGSAPIPPPAVFSARQQSQQPWQEPQQPFSAFYNTAESAPAGASSVVDARQQHNNIVVNAAPGQSPEEIGRAVNDRISSNWDDQMESTAASVPAASY